MNLLPTFFKLLWGGVNTFGKLCGSEDARRLVEFDLNKSKWKYNLDRYTFIPDISLMMLMVTFIYYR